MCAQTPAIGLIVIGVFTFIGALLGCVGAIRERAALIYAYCCVLFIVCLLQIGFGAAAGAVASGIFRKANLAISVSVLADCICSSEVWAWY